VPSGRVSSSHTLPFPTPPPSTSSSPAPFLPAAASWGLRLPHSNPTSTCSTRLLRQSTPLFLSPFSSRHRQVRASAITLSELRYLGLPAALTGSWFRTGMVRVPFFSKRFSSESVGNLVLLVWILRGGGGGFAG
jgi:hypothetical protein